MANLIDLIGRLLISALFLISAYNKIFSIDGTMSWMEGYGIPGFLLYPTIAVELIVSLPSVTVAVVLITAVSTNSSLITTVTPSSLIKGLIASRMSSAERK